MNKILFLLSKMSKVVAEVLRKRSLATHSSLSMIEQLNRANLHHLAAALSSPS